MMWNRFPYGPPYGPPYGLGLKKIQHRLEENKVILILNSKGPYDPPYAPQIGLGEK